MHHDEKWQLFAQNGEAIVGAWRSAELGNPGEDDNEIVGVTVVILYRTAENGVELLWQRRSEYVSKYPGDWDYSAGGHINLGETLPEAAVREAHEEIGAEIAPEDLCLVTVNSYNEWRICWVYMVDWTGKPNDFHFDDNEVSEVKWVPYAETAEFVREYAKQPVKEDKVTLEMLSNRLKGRELI